MRNGISAQHTEAQCDKEIKQQFVLHCELKPDLFITLLAKHFSDDHIGVYFGHGVKLDYMLT